METWVQMLLLFASIVLCSGQTSHLSAGTTPPHPIIFTPVSNISQGCASGLAALEAGLRGGGMWAIKMVDSSGRPGPGFFQGNFLWLGRFSECEQAGAPGGSKFYVIYSALTIDLDGQKEGPVQGKQGFCLPASCTEEDASLLAFEAIDALDHFLGSVNVTSIAIEYEAVMDASEEKEFFGSIYAVSRFCAILLFVLVVTMATILDLLGYEDIALHPYQELREMEADDKSEKSSEEQKEEVEMVKDRSEFAESLSASSSSIHSGRAGPNPSCHDNIEVIGVEENKSSMSAVKDDSGIAAVVAEKEHAEEKKTNVDEGNGSLDEDQQIHVVEVHNNSTDSSSDPQVLKRPEIELSAPAALSVPGAAGSTKTPPNTPRRQVPVFF